MFGCHLNLFVCSEVEQQQERMGALKFILFLCFIVVNTAVNWEKTAFDPENKTHVAAKAEEWFLNICGNHYRYTIQTLYVFCQLTITIAAKICHICLTGKIFFKNVDFLSHTRSLSSSRAFGLIVRNREPSDYSIDKRDYSMFSN